MSDLPAQVLAALDHGTPAVWVGVTATRGSVPRETGAAMLVTENETAGTIGGGHLEYKAIEFARERIAAQQTLATQRHFPLGPALGQCCGGAVELTFVAVQATDRADWQRLSDAAECGGRFRWSLPLDSGGVATLDLSFTPWQVWVFGAGHVGRAIVQVLATLPCHVIWLDTRDEPFPAMVPAGVHTVATDDPARAATGIPPGADVLVLTHSHALDFDIVLPLARRDDLGYIGVIGSGTKAATFRKRLAARGLGDAEITRMVCPIGKAADPSVNAGSLAKLPGVIAVNVVSALIERQQLLSKNPMQYGLTAENGE